MRGCRVERLGFSPGLASIGRGEPHQIREVVVPHRYYDGAVRQYERLAADPRGGIRGLRRSTPRLTAVRGNAHGDQTPVTRIIPLRVAVAAIRGFRPVVASRPVLIEVTLGDDRRLAPR